MHLEQRALEDLQCLQSPPHVRRPQALSQVPSPESQAASQNSFHAPYLCSSIAVLVLCLFSFFFQPPEYTLYLNCPAPKSPLSLATVFSFPSCILSCLWSKSPFLCAQQLHSVLWASVCPGAQTEALEWGLE